MRLGTPVSSISYNRLVGFSTENAMPNINLKANEQRIIQQEAGDL
jgi:hypothetical protein